MTPKHIFETKAPEVLASKPDLFKGISLVYLFEIQGPDGGTWHLDFRADPPTVAPGVPEKADCTVKMAQEDFETLLADFSKAMSLFASGKLKVDNPMAALKLQGVLPHLAK